MKNVAVWQLLDDLVSRELFQIIICTGYFRWLGLILAPDILARDDWGINPKRCGLFGGVFWEK